MDKISTQLHGLTQETHRRDLDDVAGIIGSVA